MRFEISYFIRALSSIYLWYRKNKKIIQAKKKVSLKYIKYHFFEKNLKYTLVLKGKNTIVKSDKKLYVNTTGNSGMATAGSGDCLTGVILSLVGQGLDAFNSAKLGVFMHGLAGDFAKESLGEDSLVASDIIMFLPNAIKYIREWYYVWKSIIDFCWFR